MKTCAKCNKEFPNYIFVDGIRKNISKRKYCLECSPFGQHNTVKLHKDNTRKCSICGETDETKFYGHKKSVCGKCHNKQVGEKSKSNKEFIIQHLGGKCVYCGYDKYPCSLDIHHLNPETKDENFRFIRGWSKERIVIELEQCVLLCRNCHSALHNGYISIE